jgi:peptidoglycan/LPS O-acetylase OafA/YrhL
VASERRTEIQWLRGLAATEVVVCHSDLVTKHFTSFRLIDTSWYQPFLGIGVEVFFMVSGYVICMRAGTHRTGGSFLFSRIRRLYPMYWIFTSLVLLALVIEPAWRLNAVTVTPGTILQSYLILPQWRFPILGVGWTLEHEMVFYAFVALLMVFWNINGRAKFVLPWLLAALGFIGCLQPVLIAGQAGPPSTQTLLVAHLFSPYMLAFGFGWLCRCADEMTPAARTWSIASYAAIVAAGFLVSSGYGTELVLRLALAGAIFGAFIAARQLFATEGLVNRLAWEFGNASFSIYLSHWFVLSVLGKVLGLLQLPSAASGMVRLLAVGLCIVIGYGIYAVIEKPLDRWLRSPRKRDGIAHAPVRLTPNPLKIPGGSGTQG